MRFYELTVILDIRTGKAIEVIHLSRRQRGRMRRVGEYVSPGIYTVEIDMDTIPTIEPIDMESNVSFDNF